MKGRPTFSPPPEASSPSRVGLPAALGLAALSALLLYLSFPHPRQNWLAWVALVPFLVACRHQGPWRGALIGAVTGAGFQATLLSWATFFGTFAMVGLVAFKTVAPALLGAALGGYRPRNPLASVAFAAMAWLSMELYQTCGPLGMTWGMLSHSQARVPVLIQIGSLFGPWGLSLVIAFVNAALAEWWLTRARRPLAAAAALTALTAVFGLWCLANPPAPSGPPVRWGVVQVSMAQNVKWDPNFQEEIMQRLETLSASAAARGAQVIVWPETAIPYRQFSEFPGLVHRVAELGRSLRAWLIVGSIERAPGNATYNSAHLFAPDGTMAGRYDKFRLVPFGEFLPWKEYLPKLPGSELVMNYAPGESMKMFGLGTGAGAPVKVCVLICYESMVSDLAREQTAKGANFLVIPTNDAWFGDSSAAPHHFDMAIMRAVEMRRPAIQAGNTGLSGFVTATGQVLQESRMDERVALVESLAPVAELSLYTRMGDVLAYASLLGALVLLVLSRRRPTPDA